jgi:hypothetical protein
VHKLFPQAARLREAAGEIGIEDLGLLQPREHAAVVVGRRQPKLGDEVRSDIDADLHGQLQRMLGRQLHVKSAEVRLFAGSAHLVQ